MSVRSNITYKELYKKVVLRLSCGNDKWGEKGGVFKVIPPLNIKYDDEHLDIARKKGRLSEDIDNPSDEEIRDLPRFEDDTVFELITTNSQGSQNERDALFNDSLPLNLKDRQCVACLWPSKHFNYYLYNSDGFAYENDNSWMNEAEQKKAGLTLDDCLRAFAAEEQLSATDTWYCGECKEHVQAHKKLSISRAPKILVVHLKRFSYRGQMSRERIDDLVKFPIQDFDISEFVEEREQELIKYDLFAISNHYGSLGGGHYTAFVRGRNDTNQWFRCDDSNVTQVDSSSICTEAAYVLFYVRKDVDWPNFVETTKDKKKDSQDEEGNNEDDSEKQDEYEEEDEEEENTKTETGTNAASEKTNPTTDLEAVDLNSTD